MRIVLCSLLTFFFVSVSLSQIIIQENALGFCAVDGIIESSVAGYTGTGYLNGDPGIGKSMSWQIHVPASDSVGFAWRFAVSGGTIAPRNARLVIDGNVVRDTILFPYTGSAWTSWTMSDTIHVPLVAGSHKIRIEAHSTSGLGNYDYFLAIGSGVSPDVCTPSYVVSVRSNDSSWGSVSYSPVRPYYDKGTQVTVRAVPNPGYFFESWTGEATSNDTVFTFPVRSNVEAVARFLPAGTLADSAATGYATVQDDSGTTYMLFGGALGDTVTANSVDELRTYLASSEPLVVLLDSTLVGTDVLTVTSNKTLLGTGPRAHLRGIELSINAARNVIIRDITISHVTPQDALEINGKSKNILIDRCEFYSDRDHGTEYYDGLLDIKNESSFITVSRSSFHDHYKTCLISSGDQAVPDSVIRITFHHDYFYNCESRLPSIRFGKAHIYNNYYKSCNTAVNSRMGAWVRVERNYFESVGTAVMTEYSAVTGLVQLIDNRFGGSAYVTTPVCDLVVPYSYTLDATDDVPAIVASEVRTEIEQEASLPRTVALAAFPNPFNPTTVIRYQLSVASDVELHVCDLLGRSVAQYVEGRRQPGKHEIRFDAGQLTSGVYIVRMRAGHESFASKLLLVR